MSAFDVGLVFSFSLALAAIMPAVFGISDKKRRNISGLWAFCIVLVTLTAAVFFAYHFKWESDLLGISATSDQPIATPISEVATPILPQISATPDANGIPSDAQSIDSVHDFVLSNLHNTENNLWPYGYILMSFAVGLILLLIFRQSSAHRNFWIVVILGIIVQLTMTISYFVLSWLFG